MDERVKLFLAKAKRHLADDTEDRAQGIMPCSAVMISTEDVRALVEFIDSAKADGE